MGEVNIRKVENKIFLLGNNEYETGVLTVPANSTVPIGALLKRVEGKFVPATNTEPDVFADIPVAVNPEDIKNPDSSPADIPFRALIGGRVRRDMLSINGAEITDVQADMLRLYGIIPKKVTDISWAE